MPNWGIYISIDQLGYPRAAIRDVVGLAKTFNRDAALVILGTYNLALSLVVTRENREDGTGDRVAAQEALLRNSISETRLRELRHRFGNANLLKRPLFHRAQLLTMIKLVAKFGHTTAGNMLEHRQQFDDIAELGLLVNSLWAGPRATGDPGDAIAPILARAASPMSHRQLAPSMAA